MISNGGYYDDCILHNDRLRDDLRAPNGYFDEGFDAKDTLEYKLWHVSEQLIVAKGFPLDIDERIVDEL